MKNLKKLLSIFAAFFLVFSLTAGVRAEGNSQGTNNNNGIITLTNPIEGKTYSLYQLLKLESYNKDLDAYSYTVADDWRSFFNGSEIKDKYIKFDATNTYVTWVEQADPVAFSKLALAYAEANHIMANVAKTASKIDGNVNPVVFNNLNLGYYLLDSSAGALCSLVTTAPTVDITEKNAIPTVEKEVQEDSDESWGNKNDAQIGDTVNFRATINVGNNTEGSNAGAQNYVLHDTMSDGLTFQEVSKVELIRNDNTSEVNAENYNVKTTNLQNEETFNVEFTPAFCDTLEQNDVIVVYYSAVINENAVVAGEGNPNQVVLEYGDKNDSSNKTEPSKTITYTWPVGIYKYTNNGQEIALAGAQFQLKTSVSEKEIAIKLIDKTEANGIPTYRIATAEELSLPNATSVETITTNDEGKFIIEGLNNTTYYLHETKAPDGYNNLAGPIEIKVTSTQNTNNPTKLDYSIEGSDPDVIAGYQTIKVLNTTGTTLPETGGMGTTLLYVAGGILLIGSAVLLVTKKRMGHEN